MPSQTNAPQTHNRMAIMYMLAAVILFSTVPLALSIGQSQDTPFLFNAILKFGISISALLFLTVRYRKLAFDKEIWAKALANYQHPAVFLAILGNLDYVLFAWSLKYIDVAVSAILFEIWPLILVLMMAYIFKEDRRYKKLGGGTLILFVLGFIGFSFVIVSQNSSSGSLSVSVFPSTNNAVITGVVLATLAAVVRALPTVFTLQWGARLGEKDNDRELFFTVLIFAITQLFGSIILGALGTVSNEVITNHQIVVALGYGIIVNASASILLRRANLATDNLGINALSYTTPVFALIWLGLFSLLTVPRLDILILGTTAIAVTNILVNFKADIRLSYQCFIISLWSCGVVAYLLEKTRLDGYYEAIAILVTMFTLILSFRIDRIVRRTTEEDKDAVALLHQLSILHEEGRITQAEFEDCAPILARIDGTNDKDETLDDIYGSANLKEDYNDIKRNIYSAQCRLVEEQNREGRRELSSFEHLLDTLVHSKQQGKSFGEMIAIFIIGTITVVSLLCFRPDGISGWSGFMVDMFSFLLASSIVFLFFYVIDLQGDRNRAVMEKIDRDHKDHVGKFSLIFRDATNRSFEQGVSVVICLAIVASFAGILWDKWLNNGALLTNIP